MIHCQKLKTQPDLLALHQLKPDQYPYLLASNTRGQVNTRFSILMAYPEQQYVQHSGQQDILNNISIPLTDIPKDSFPECAKELPFLGGWFVYLSYEYAQFVESGVQFFDEASDIPIALISRIPAAVIIDHVSQQSFVVSIAARGELIKLIQCDILEALPETQQKLPISITTEEDPDIYRNNVKKAQQYIYDGDIFQANLSREWVVDFHSACDPIAVYQQLKRHNPSPFAAMVKLGDTYLLSSSPERLISLKNGVVETRPIAGTHPRGNTEAEDGQLAIKLLSHPKERAEHIMLIDLERNDLGRICIPGTISVAEKMCLETYQHVHHIVSSVHGKLQEGVSFKDIIHAVFPGGTITGCPKVRCMEIISELEQKPRGAYTGSLGYVSDHGVMDMNILIRTMTVNTQSAKFRAGAGIVIDSEVEKELNETRHKARGLINAIQADF